MPNDVCDRRAREAVAKLVPLAEEVNRIAVTGLNPADVAKTRQLLLTVIENLAGDEEHSENTARRVPSTRELARRVANGAKGRRARA